MFGCGLLERCAMDAGIEYDCNQVYSAIGSGDFKCLIIPPFPFVQNRDKLLEVGSVAEQLVR